MPDGCRSDIGHFALRILGASLTIIMLLGAAPVHARTLRLESGASLQDSIASSQDGDVIEVGPGTYFGPVRIDRTIVIRGAGGKIDGQGVGRVISVVAPGARVEGLTIHNSGYEVGDLLFGAYGAQHFSMQAFAAGMNLELYQSDISDYIAELQRMGNEMVPQWLLIYQQTVQNFRVVAPEPHKIKGTYFDEDKRLPGILAAKDMTGMGKHSINKLIWVFR